MRRACWPIGQLTFSAGSQADDFRNSCPQASARTFFRRNTPPSLTTNSARSSEPSTRSYATRSKRVASVGSEQKGSTTSPREAQGSAN